MELLDPSSESDASARMALSPRIDSLEGKTIGLYDNGKVTGEPVLDVVEERLSERYPDATFERYALGKNAINEAKDPDVLAAITDWAAAMDACIGAYGDCGSCTKFLAWGIQAIEEANTPAVGLIDSGFEFDYQSNSIERGWPLRYTILPVRSETPDIARVRERMTAAAIDAIEDELTRPLDAEERAEAVVQ